MQRREVSRRALAPPDLTTSLCIKQTDTMPTRDKKHCMNNLEQIKFSGLLSAERLAEIESEIKARISPCFDAKGVPVKGAAIADCGPERRLIFTGLPEASAVQFMERCVLAAVLSEAELTLINDRCLAANRTAEDFRRFDKAQKLQTWDAGIFFNETYHSSMEDFLKSLHGRTAWPEFVWAAESRTVIAGLTVDDVVESCLADRGWDDMTTSDLEGVSELATALAQFTIANAAVVSYWPDYTKAILLSAWKSRPHIEPACAAAGAARS